jgi:hypothetical protein
MNPPAATSVVVGEWVSLAGEGYVWERAFAPTTERAVLVAVKRFRLLGSSHEQLADVELSLLPGSFAELGLAVQDPERIFLAGEGRELLAERLWPHVLIRPTIRWRDDLVCRLRADSTPGHWTGRIRLKWCQGEEAALARREVALWTNPDRRREFIDWSRHLARRADVTEYQVVHWGALLALRREELAKTAICFRHERE